MIYNVAKSIGAASTVLCGKVDAILLTGGIAYSDYVISRLRERISFLRSVSLYPGEDEMEALALNACRALRENFRYRFISNFRAWLHCRIVQGCTGTLCRTAQDIDAPLHKGSDAGMIYACRVGPQYLPSPLGCLAYYD